jgi:serine/threonine protein kinase
VYSLKILNLNSYMIMERLSSSLDDIFEEKKKRFDIKTIILIAYQMFKSLEVLHRSGYTHRDIKPENIMTCFNSHKLKLIDFGLADSL